LKHHISFIENLMNFDRISRIMMKNITYYDEVSL